MSGEGPLERLVIIEQGDAAESVAERRPVSSSLAPKREEEHAGQGKRAGDMTRKKMCSEDDQTGEVVVTEEDVPGETENDGHNRGDSESGGRTAATASVTTTREKAGDTGGEKATQKDPQVDIGRLNSSERRSDGTQSQEEDPKKAHRLTADFPEALYELLCTLQEGRRLNDQRCSFQLEGGVRRRRCHSEPNTSKPANRVVFSSMTSLQKEEFFELVATAQARRLDDQRAQLEKSQPPKPKSRGFRGSLKQLSFVKRPAVPVPVPKEDLYNMILTTQAQGRLEDQRSRAPGPMDDEDFFSLLLRVQGGRMDEQRTELPGMLQT
ncbi:G-protein-signaling modulator 1 [Cyclopterus lumpus]|uniref:G-protein signaling modulator 3 n=1 Tax=Cyclopterus lumpus TaxID=8103 RepID=A0A8C3ACX7_CYCLU|nr:G-protein-signaling modulator 1 [Cyclopterus lumpus]XP_034384469.1 G-protein-signaling modulator 1 [Cyclopterus lumpus]XP_034384470.1 G-protein-signaling modulator 1 [Cyclopterus lumpus]